MIEGSSFRRDRAPSGPGRSTQKANGRSLGVVLYEPSGRGGVCHYTYRLAEALAAEGCRVTLVTTRDYELEHLPRRFRLRFLFKPSAVKRFLSSATSRVARRRPSKTASGPPPAPSLRRPPILVALRTLRVRLLQFLLALELLWRRPDVVHFQLVSPARDLFLIRLLLRLGLPVVYTAHDVLPQDPRSAARWSSHAKVYGLVDRLVVHAESDRREMVTLFGVDPRKISVIAHGSYDFLFPEGEIAREDARRRVGFPAEARIVLFFGLIKRYKGLEFLVEAFRRVRDRVPDALLAVVGGLFRDADGYDFYRRLLDEICEDPRILCVPKYVPLEDVGLYLSAADVIVLPYTKIYQSGVLLAAYAAGRPVVATSTGGLPEVVEHGRSGLVVPPRDPEALASALVDLLEDLPRAVAMGKRALELGRTRYSWDGIAEQTANLYRAILEERRAGGGQTVSRVLPVLDPPPPERSGQVRR